MASVNATWGGLEKTAARESAPTNAQVTVNVFMAFSALAILSIKATTAAYLAAPWTVPSMANVMKENALAMLGSTETDVS